MIRQTFAAIALIAAAPLAAQTITQEEIDARYDRALAAGYKALMLCSAIANAERNGATREVDSIAQWELTGIQVPLDTIVTSLHADVVRSGTDGSGKVDRVMVTWADEMPPRIAYHGYPDGCSLAPIGYSWPEGRAMRSNPLPPPPAGSWWALEGAERQLDPVISKAFTASYGEGARTTAVTIARNGRLIAEQYADGFDSRTPQRTWSVAKSIAATLVGAAVQNGSVKVSNSAGLGESATDPRSAITIDNLLRMASGRYGDMPGSRTDPLYFGGSTVAETALNAPLVHTPGSAFRYANNDTLAAVQAIKNAGRINPEYDLFEKTGMIYTVSETDWRGDYILSSQVWSTARDLAKLGQLYLDDGLLPNGERILPENWLEYVSTPSGPQPDGPFGYGAGFWLLNQSEGVPADTIAAMGNRGQYVVIVPSHKLVIVRRGEDPVGARFDVAAFTRDILENIGE